MQLSALLRGEVPDPIDWRAALALAGETLVTTELARQLDLNRVPDDVRALLVECARRNALRDQRLQATLAEIVHALNAADIVPVLLKGSALWPERVAERGRLVSDLDILVRPGEVERALITLASAGFETLSDKRHVERHPVIELGRKQDVGVLDLHQRAPGALAMDALADLAASCSQKPFMGGRVLAPSSEVQIAISAVHDQLNDAAFANGNFNLRHLMDVVELAARPSGVNWEALAALAPNGLARMMIAAQLCAAHDLLGVDVPRHLRSPGEAHFSRQKLQYGLPAINAALRSLWINHATWRSLAHWMMAR